MVNKYFRYDNFDIWAQETWKERMVPIDDLIQWIGKLDTLREKDYRLPEGAYCPQPSDENGFVGYLASEEIEFWDRLGIKIEVHHIWTAKWISFVPKTAVRNSGVLYPTIVSMHQEHVSEGCWPMKTMMEYREKAKTAADKQVIYLIIVTDGADITKQYANIIMEAISLYPIDYNNIRLDVSAVYEKGHRLAELPGKLPADETGILLKNADDHVEKVDSFFLLDISRTWRSMGSPHWGQLIGVDGKSGGNAEYDAERFKHSLAALRLVEPISMELKYRSDSDPMLLAFWEQHGLKYETHVKNHERWVTLTPLSALEDPEAKLPIVLLFQEVYFCNDHLPVEACSYWYEYCKLAMQGDCMLLFYACECEEHNELLYEIFQDARKMYPVDESRVYITGYSHNSAAATKFAYAHPEMITALAGGIPGLMLKGPGSNMDSEEKTLEKLSALQEIDMPCIVVMGQNEHNQPIGERTYENSGFHIMLKNTTMQVCNCRERTPEEFREAFQSGDKATRMMGLPNDRSEVLYLEGVEHYIADVKNKEGNYHLRFVEIENMPHNPFPTLQILEWSYIRRFSRDPKTHKIAEIY